MGHTNEMHAEDAVCQPPKQYAEDTRGMTAKKAYCNVRPPRRLLIVLQAQLCCGRASGIGDLQVEENVGNCNLQTH